MEYRKYPFKVSNNINDVYYIPPFSKKITKKIDNNKKTLNNDKIEGFGCSDTSFNTQECKTEISNNMLSLKTHSTFNDYQQTSPEIDENYRILEKNINDFIKANNKSSEQDMIDDNGNLLLNNIDVAPTKRDALLEDTKNNLIQQNNMYIIGSFLITTIMIFIVISK